jgi:L-alanine-DL-glutamate epimerase-like enolase superfamily enzyme
MKTGLGRPIPDWRGPTPWFTMALGECGQTTRLPMNEDDMKIKSIDSFAVSLPMKKPVTMAGETVTRADNVFVRVETDDGLIGWGEAASAPTMTGETTASMMAAVAHMKPALLDRAADDFTEIGAAMNGAIYGNTGAKAAIDIALHDLVARAAGRPLHALFGAKLRSHIPVLAVIGSTDEAADLREAQDRWAAGYRAFKIKVGLAEPEADGARIRAVCRKLKAQSDESLVSADANQGFTVEEALRFATTLGDCGLDFFEQPVRAENLDGMARVAAASRVPIGADEGIHSLHDIERHHARRAAAGVSLKAIKLGGLRALHDACALCDRLGMKVNISCKTGESSVASAAALHLAATAPALAWGLTLTNHGLAEDAAAAPLRIENGHVAVPDRPGLGIEVDEHRLRCSQQGLSTRKVA